MNIMPAYEQHMFLFSEVWKVKSTANYFHLYICCSESFQSQTRRNMFTFKLLPLCVFTHTHTHTHTPLKMTPLSRVNRRCDFKSEKTWPHPNLQWATRAKMKISKSHNGDKIVLWNLRLVDPVKKKELPQYGWH